jgi:hypothetical protein
MPNIIHSKYQPQTHKITPNMADEKISPSAGVLFRSNIDIPEGQIVFQNHLKARRYGLLMNDPTNNRYRAVFEAGKDGHLYPVTRSIGKSTQAEKTPIIIKMSADGVNAYREAVSTIGGSPEFMHEFYDSQPANIDTQVLMKHPQVMSYFCDPEIEGFNFIVMPNAGYELSPAVLECKPSAKFEMPGVMLCAWFHSKHQRSVTEKIQKILEDLKPECTRKPHLEEAIADFESKPPTTVASIKVAEVGPYKSREKSIKKLQQEGLYLASVFDLECAHVPALKRLEKHILSDLRRNYNLLDEDRADMYFHYLYGPRTATLHLHVRVNQGQTAYERDRSVSMSQLIADLSKGKTMGDILMEKLAKNPQSAFHERHLPSFVGFFIDENGCDLIPGVTCHTNVKNVYKLTARSEEEPSI